MFPSVFFTVNKEDLVFLNLIRDGTTNLYTPVTILNKLFKYKETEGHLCQNRVI